MLKPVKKIAITGGAGQIAYSLLFRVASGEMLGLDQPVSLHILETAEALPALEGVKMELEDCAFPLLQEVHIGSDPFSLFKDIDLALLIGAKPRGPGMERGDLLKDNGKIFVTQGKALNESAKTSVKVLVIGNPCNTNCLIAMHHAPRIPRRNFFAMTRLDQNRAAYQLANKAQVEVKDISRIAIWGNHSATQVPDFASAAIKGRPLLEVIKDRDWLEKDFFSTVQQRGAAIIKSRGKSSAASAANAAIDTIKSLYLPLQADEWFSLGVCSDNNPYSVQNGLIFSFPCHLKLLEEWEIVKDIAWIEFIHEKIKLTERELLEERDLIKDMIH